MAATVCPSCSTGSRSSRRRPSTGDSSTLPWCARWGCCRWSTCTSTTTGTRPWRTSAHRADRLAQGDMPESALALVGQVKLYERLTVAAAVEGSYDSAIDALLTHPLVGAYPLAKAILDGYIQGLGGLLPALR